MILPKSVSSWDILCHLIAGRPLWLRHLEGPQFPGLGMNGPESPTNVSGSWEAPTAEFVGAGLRAKCVTEGRVARLCVEIKRGKQNRLGVGIAEWGEW